ncbi:MAG: AMP-binding protein [Hyphomicrobiaceae bacterium]
MEASEFEAGLPAQPGHSPVPSYASGTTNQPLVYATVGQLLDRAAGLFGEREAIIGLAESRRLTYSQLQTDANKLARAMIGYGLRPGDRIALWAPNSVNWVVLQLAAAKAGLILVTVNPAYRVAEISYVLAHSGARVLFSTPRLRERDFTTEFAKIQERVPAVETIVVINGGTPEICNDLGNGGHTGTDPLSGANGISRTGGDNERHITWDAFKDFRNGITDKDLERRATGLSPEDPVNIQYTSGTTGSPKGATLTHHNIVNNALFVGRGQAFTPRDRICIPVPFFHCFGNVLGTLSATAHGCSMVLPGETFDPRTTLSAIHQERCTAVYAVPMMFIAMLNHSDFHRFDLTSLRTGVTGAAPCPIEVMRDVVVRMHLSELTICYGMTETSPISTQTKIGDDVERQCETVGTILPHLECKIVERDTGQTVPRGVTGEYCLRGYSVMSGYWDNPKATAAAIDSHGWMHSGDLAIMRHDGYVSVVGRAKDIIIRGGENIQPREIEEYFHTFKEVEDVQVIGVPDETYGEAVCAWIKLVAGAQVNEDDIRQRCHGQIASYKIPRYVHFVDEFPVTASGKVQKFRMRELMIQELGLEAPRASEPSEKQQG